VTRGLSVANMANPWLDTISNTSFAAGAVSAAKIHTGDPGSAGTANASSVTTRQTLSWAAASSGSKATNATASWTSWAGTSPETVTDISVWDSTTAGNFRFSAQLTTSKTLTTGDQLNLTAVTVTISPLAA
jgi:hypothetical protein